MAFASVVALASSTSLESVDDVGFGFIKYFARSDSNAPFLSSPLNKSSSLTVEADKEVAGLEWAKNAFAVGVNADDAGTDRKRRRAVVGTFMVFYSLRFPPPV